MNFSVFRYFDIVAEGLYFFWSGTGERPAAGAYFVCLVKGWGIFGHGQKFDTMKNSENYL